MKKIIRITTLIIMAIYITGCGENAGTGKNPGEQEALTSEKKDKKGHSEENTVALSPQQWEAINIKLGALEKVNLDGTLKVTGELELYPQDEATVGSFIDGNISRVFVKPGAKIKKGQLLAYIEDPAFIDLQAELRQLHSEFQYLQREFERQQKLYENEVASGKSYQKTTSEFNVVKARLEGIKARLRLLKVSPDAIINGKTYEALPVTSPISGYVREIGVTIGQRITTGSQLFRIINKENIHADLLVYEKDLGKIKEDQKVTLYIANNRDKPVAGTITEIGKNYENTIRAVRIHAGLDGDKAPFVPGMFVEGVIAVKNIRTTALPEQAVVEDEGKTYIFIVRESAEDSGKPSRTFTRAEVITGAIADGWIEVRSMDSLPRNTRVVTQGAYYLLAEMKKGETEHVH